MLKNELHSSTLEDSTLKYIHHLIKSHNRIQDSSLPIVANTFTLGGKDINGGVELPRAQWAICKPKNKISACHNISNR